MKNLTALKARVDALYLEYVFPVLAALRLGEDAEAVAYETELLAAAKAAGVRVRRYIMPDDLSQEDIAGLIREINLAPLLSAFLLLEPLPAHLDATALKAAVAPEKALEAGPVLNLLSRVCDAAERNAK